MISDEEFFKGCSMTLIEDGIIEVSKRKWYKFLINSKKTRRYVAETMLYEEYPYEIDELLISMGIFPEGKVMLYGDITYGGINYVVHYGNHLAVVPESTENETNQQVEKVDMTLNEVLHKASAEIIDIIDIEEVYKNSSNDLDAESGIILYRNGLCLDLMDYEKLSRGEWLADSTVDFFVQHFFVENVPIAERNIFVVTKTTLLRDIQLMIDYEGFAIPESLKKAIERPLRGKKFLDVEFFVMPILSEAHFKLVVVVHDKNSSR